MSKNSSPLALIVRILERAEALGLTVEREMGNDTTLPETDSGSFGFVRVDGGTAAMIIPLKGKTVSWCDSHIEWTGKGYIDGGVGGGAVLCRVDPSELDLDAYLKALSGASKRAKKRASKAASQELDALKAKLQSLGLPKASQPASPAVIVRTPEPQPVDSDADDIGDFVDA